MMFLDANAHVPLSKKAVEAGIQFQKSLAAHGHPSSLSGCGRAASTALEESRAKIAELIGTKSPNQIIFTSSCTQAADWGLRLYQISTECKNVLAENIRYSPFEHSSVSSLTKNFPVLSCDSDGVLATPHNKCNLICIHLQNEMGTIQPIFDFKLNSLFSDFSQSLGKVSLPKLQDTQVEVGIFGAHKFGGPGGFGWIYLKDPEGWESYNNQPSYFLDRPGSPDVGGAVMTAAALEEALETLPTRAIRMAAFQETLERGLEAMGLEIIGKKAHRSFNTTLVGGVKQAPQTLLELSEAGIYVGLGSACSSFHTGVSPLMQTLGKPYTTDQLLRISQWGDYDHKDALKFLEIFAKIQKDKS